MRFKGDLFKTKQKNGNTILGFFTSHKRVRETEYPTIVINSHQTVDMTPYLLEDPLINMYIG